MIQTLWTRALIGTNRQIETAEPKEGLVPQPQKMLINSAQKAAVSPATNRVTSHGIARINPRILKPTNPLSRKAKARQAAITEDEETSDEEIDYGSPEANTWVRKGQVLPVKEKEDIVRMAWEAETGMLVGPEADF